MKWMLDLSMRGKLLVSFGLMIALLGTVITLAYLGITSVQGYQRKIYQKDFTTAINLLKMRSDENGARASLLSMFLVAQPDNRELWLDDIKNRTNRINDLQQELTDENRNDPHFVNQLEEIKSVRASFIQTRDAQIIPLINAGKIDQAKELALGPQEELYGKMRNLAQKLGDEAVDKAHAEYMQSEAQTEKSIGLFVIAGVAALLLGVAMTFLLNRIIASPLMAISGIAEKLGGGDLTVDVPHSNRQDEVGILSKTFRTMLENLRQSTRETLEGINVLSSSSAEILATTTQIASGAAETATAVSETTATVEEIKQTAQLASQKAKYVSESAQKASQVSQTGRKAVEDAIQRMHHIQEQMESIAESIVRLSEQSQAIGEIIATVNDLAEQSNILAVNAAIEANKAGEQGKGFVIVAQEVKSLAEQSKQATAQVRAILGDIQKATSAAVMATEQGSKAVEAGVKQSAEANESIRQLADSVGEAAQAATQIAASSQQQMVGMDQVAMAMENIKQASVQNVAGTKQAESAAQNLHDLGQRLKQLADLYKV